MKTVKYLALPVVMALVGCVASHGTSPKGLEVPIETAAVKFSRDLKDGGYNIVNTAELKRWLDEGKKLTIISTLTEFEDRELGIIPDSLGAPMPANEKDFAPEDREHMLRAAGDDKTTVLIVYGSSVACRRSHIGAKFLLDNGYKNVFRYPAGISGWKESGYPLKK